MVELIFGFIISLLVALIMLGIGFSQYKSKKPVGFYSGERPPLECEVTDVEASCEEPYKPKYKELKWVVIAATH